MSWDRQWVSQLFWTNIEDCVYQSVSRISLTLTAALSGRNLHLDFHILGRSTPKVDDSVVSLGFGFLHLPPTHLGDRIWRIASCMSFFKLTWSRKKSLFLASLLLWESNSRIRSNTSLKHLFLESCSFWCLSCRIIPFWNQPRVKSLHM